MRMECDERVAAANEVEYLTPFGVGPYAKLQAIVAIAYHDEVEPWLIGQAAWLAWDKKKGSGFSPGTTQDETKRRANWASCANKALHKWGLRARMDELKCLRESGGKRQSVTWEQMIDRVDHHIFHSKPGESMRAIELKIKLTGNKDTGSAAKFVEQMVIQVGPERTRRGLEELGYGHLIYALPDAFIVKDYDARLTNLEQKRLEEGNEQSRPAARRAGDDSRNLDRGGSRGVGDDAAREVDAGSSNAVGAGTSERPVSSREINERLKRSEANL